MPEKTLRLKVLQKSSSLENLEKVAVPKITLASAIVNNCSSKLFTYFMNNCNYCCEIVKLTESICSESHPCKCKCLQLLF